MLNACISRFICSRILSGADRAWVLKFSIACWEFLLVSNRIGSYRNGMSIDTGFMNKLAYRSSTIHVVADNSWGKFDSLLQGDYHCPHRLVTILTGPDQLLLLGWRFSARGLKANFCSRRRLFNLAGNDQIDSVRLGVELIQCFDSSLPQGSGKAVQWRRKVKQLLRPPKCVSSIRAWVSKAGLDSNLLRLQTTNLCLISTGRSIVWFAQRYTTGGPSGMISPSLKSSNERSKSIPTKSLSGLKTSNGRSKRWDSCIFKCKPTIEIREGVEVLLWNLAMMIPWFFSSHHFLISVQIRNSTPNRTDVNSSSGQKMCQSGSQLLSTARIQGQRRGLFVHGFPPRSCHHVAWFVKDRGGLCSRE